MPPDSDAAESSPHGEAPGFRSHGRGRGDSSAAPERTRLAWRRTTLSGTVVAVLMARLAVERQNLAIAALAGLCWVFLIALIHRRIQDLKTPGRPPRRLTMLTAAACLALGGLGVVVVLI